MNQKPKASSLSVKLSPDSVRRSVTQVEPPPFLEFFAQHSMKPKQPDEFSSEDFKKATRSSEGQTTRALKKRVEDGNLEVRVGLENGRRCNLYRIIK